MDVHRGRTRTPTPVLEGYDADQRAALRRHFRRDAEARAKWIGRLHERVPGNAVEELLIGLEADEVARATMVTLLEGMQEDGRTRPE